MLKGSLATLFVILNFLTFVACSSLSESSEDSRGEFGTCSSSGESFERREDFVEYFVDGNLNAISCMQFKISDLKVEELVLIELNTKLSHPSFFFYLMDTETITSKVVFQTLVKIAVKRLDNLEHMERFAESIFQDIASSPVSISNQKNQYVVNVITSWLAAPRTVPDFERVTHIFRRNSDLEQIYFHSASQILKYLCKNVHVSIMQKKLNVQLDPINPLKSISFGSYVIMGARTNSFHYATDFFSRLLVNLSNVLRDEGYSAKALIFRTLIKILNRDSEREFNLLFRRLNEAKKSKKWKSKSLLFSISHLESQCDDLLMKMSVQQIQIVLAVKVWESRKETKAYLKRFDIEKVANRIRTSTHEFVDPEIIKTIEYFKAIKINL